MKPRICGVELLLFALVVGLWKKFFGRKKDDEI